MTNAAARGTHAREIRTAGGSNPGKSRADSGTHADEIRGAIGYDPGASHADAGTSMIECAAALVLAAMLTAELGRSLHASALLVSRAKLRSRAVDVTRNLLESEIGSPCGPPYACPDDFVCSLSRSTGVANGIDRLRAGAAARQGSGKVELSVLVRAAECS